MRYRLFWLTVGWVMVGVGFTWLAVLIVRGG